VILNAVIKSDGIIYMGRKNFPASPWVDSSWVQMAPIVQKVESIKPSKRLKTIDGQTLLARINQWVSSIKGLASLGKTR